MKDNMQQNKCNVQETTSPPQAAKRPCPTITHPLQGTSDKVNDEAITQPSPAKKPRTESTKTVCPSIQSNKVSNAQSFECMLPNLSCKPIAIEMYVFVRCFSYLSVTINCMY